MRYVSAVLNVNHRNEVLVFRFHIADNILELHFGVYLRAVEMIGSHAQSDAARLAQVVLVGAVHVVLAFRGFQIYIGNLASGSHSIPVDALLIVRHVNAFAIARVDAPSVLAGHAHCFAARHAWALLGLGGQRVGVEHRRGNGVLGPLAVAVARRGGGGREQKENQAEKDG